MPQKDNNEYDFIQATISRDLMKLEGGPLGLALGASYYYQKLNADNSAPCKDGSVAGLNCFYAIGDQANTAVYAEINAPVLKSLESTPRSAGTTTTPGSASGRRSSAPSGRR